MNEYEKITQTHALYRKNRSRWLFLLNNYQYHLSERQQVVGYFY